MRATVLFLFLTIQVQVFSCCFCTNSWVTLNTDSLSSHSIISLESRSQITNSREYFYVLQSKNDRVPLNLIGKHTGDGIYSIFLKPSRNLIEG